ncbi:helix-turn-helix domain-containing protein [Streptosporangium algeriense]|uniref:Helix-turn-helix domain-containing protein n=1 Tax=Streptosporangium algeriense TaxID=1682748 RepID=A0ABW3DN67_9ACTN
MPCAVDQGPSQSPLWRVHFVCPICRFCSVRNASGVKRAPVRDLASRIGTGEYVVTVAVLRQSGCGNLRNFTCEEGAGVTTGRELRALRESQKVSLDVIAKAANASKGHISRVERGEREVTPALIATYEKTLGVPVAATSHLEANGVAPGTVDDVRRRTLLSTIAAASLGAAALEPLSRLLSESSASLPSHGAVGITEVEAIENATSLYMGMDLARHGDVASAMARGVLMTGSSFLDRKMSGSTRERLHSALGLLADRLGWAEYDGGAPVRAVSLLTVALDHASRGPDRDLRAHTMLDLSTVLADTGRAKEGVEVLRLALGDDRMSSAERANLHAVAGRHCATAGDRAAGLRHVAQSEEAAALHLPAQAPEWARRIVLSKGHHDSALGLALYALGEDAKAHQRLTSAVERLDSGRTRTGLRCLTRLAILDLRAGNTQQGEAKALRAAEEASTLRSTRITADMRMMLEAARQYTPALTSDLTATLSA